MFARTVHSGTPNILHDFEGMATMRNHYASGLPQKQKQIARYFIM